MSYSLLSYTALIMYLYMGFTFWKVNTRGRINILFLILSLLLAYCSSIEVIECYFSNEKLLYQMDQVSQIGWLNYPGVLFWICLIIIEKEEFLNNKFYKIIIFVPSILFTIYELFINNYSLKTTKMVLYILRIEYFYFYTYAIVIILLMFNYYKTTKFSMKRKRNQTKILLYFGLVTIIMSAVADIFAPITLDHITLLVFIFSVRYIHVQYKFLNLSSLVTAEDIVDKITDIVITIDTDGNILGINKMGEEVLNYTRHELTGSPLSRIINHDYPLLFQEVITNNNITLDEGLFIKAHFAHDIPIRLKAFAVKDKVNELLGIVIICQDKTLINNLQDEVNERKRKEEQLNYLSLHDPLTGLFNRAHFEQQIQVNETVVPMGIIICDIDGLKLINDTMGHNAGDQLLISAANALKSSLHKDGILFRIGGDEFVILLPYARKEVITQICEQIQKNVDDYNLNNPLVLLSISMGFTSNDQNGKNVHELFKEADDNMYRDKLNHTQSIRNIMVKGMMKTLEARDFITEGHAERLKELVLELGIYLDLSKDRINNLQLLAQFHDLGKVGIADRILFKPEALNDSEKVEMQRHSEIGFRIAQTIPDLYSISDLILKHHERWDGKGYPLGIQGEEIPLECRILSIVDAFDAMTNDRPYRKAMNRDAAVLEILNNAGSQFDPNILSEFLDILKINDNEDDMCQEPTVFLSYT